MKIFVSTKFLTRSVATLFQRCDVFLGHGSQPLVNGFYICHMFSDLLRK